MTGKRPETESGLGYVYLVRNPRTGLFKIGSARRPLTRLSQLSREMCSKCEMLHTIATNDALRLEREVQGRFLDRHQGGEWFELDGVAVGIIQAVSAVWYRDAEWFPRERSRALFDAGASWAKKLPICGSC